MSRVKITLLALVAVFVASFVMSATAGAVIQGPWWKKLENGQQVKIEQTKELQVKSINEGSFILKTRALEMNITIECRKVEDKGFIWNGPHTGRDESKIKFTECLMVTPCAGTAVTVEESKVRTELMWKYQGNTSELGEAGGVQKIYDVFAPEEAPVEFEPGKFRAKFTTITVPKPCVVNGAFPVYAEGSRLLNWKDQKGNSFEVIWGTAALVEPQNNDATTGRLKWELPNVTKLHVEEAPQEAKLQFGTNAAELKGTIKVEGELELVAFGAWDKL
jgi:hypothetical protein